LPSELGSENTGNISAIFLSESQLSEEERKNAAEFSDQKELGEILALAEKEYKRLESTAKEFYLVLANPPSILLPPEKVDSLMKSLGSRKELSGSWLPVVVRVRNGFYLRVWGKTAYCG